MRPVYWLPPVLWMAVILWFSSDVGSAEHTAHWLFPLLKLLAPWVTPAQLDGLHWLVRKAAHVIEYAVLGALWFLAFARGRSWSLRPAAWAAFGISLAWAVVDESLQSLNPARSGRAVDVAIDGAGALLAVTIARFGWRQSVDRVTTALLWVGLIGGAGLLVANALAGVASGALWLTAPTAALLLVLRHTNARHRPRR